MADDALSVPGTTAPPPGRAAPAAQLKTRYHRFGFVRRSGFRWGLAAAGLLAGGMLLVFGLVYWLAVSALFGAVDKAVLEQLELLSERPADLLPFMIASRMQHQPQVITSVGLFDAGGDPVVGNITAVPAGLRLDRHIHEVATPCAQDEPPPCSLRAAGRILADGRILVVARPTDDLVAARKTLIWALVLGMGPAILICLIAGAAAGMRTQHRLVQLRVSAARIMEGRLEERLPTLVPDDDLGEIAALVNRMLDRLQELFEALKGAGEDIAHDIRSPLTWVRSGLERARDGTARPEEVQPALEQAIAGIDQVLRTVTALLRIAEIEKVRRCSGFRCFDVVEVVRDVTETYRPVAEDKQLTLQTDLPGPLEILGDCDLLMEALVNLIDNAVKFTPAGGTVSVAVAANPAGPVLRIADTGPGIRAQERDLVLRRFYRADRSRGSPGTGLGLSLVKAVVDLHGFGLRLGDGNPGCVVELSCWPQDRP